MHVLATAGDTWGISGSTFLGLYAALAVIATVLARRSLARSLAPAPAPRLNNPDDVAYLHRWASRNSPPGRSPGATTATQHPSDADYPRYATFQAASWYR